MHLIIHQHTLLYTPLYPLNAPPESPSDSPSYLSPSTSFIHLPPASCDVPIGNVNIIMISTDDTPGAVSVTYQVQAPETNYATVASSLTSPTAVSSLSVALNKAGYRDALVDSAPTLVDMSPTSAPSVASTLKVVMLTATQDVADVSVSQAASSEFQTAFLTGVIDVLQEADENLLSTGVKITTINADPSGSGVSVTYSVTENKASPKVLEDAIISPAMTNRINTDLHAAGKTFDNCIRSIHSMNTLEQYIR